MGDLDKVNSFNFRLRLKKLLKGRFPCWPQVKPAFVQILIDSSHFFFFLRNPAPFKNIFFLVYFILNPAWPEVGMFIHELLKRPIQSRHRKHFCSETRVQHPKPIVCHGSLVVIVLDFQ